jgi:hypothetical protein
MFTIEAPRDRRTTRPRAAWGLWPVARLAAAEGAAAYDPGLSGGVWEPTAPVGGTDAASDPPAGAGAAGPISLAELRERGVDVSGLGEALALHDVALDALARVDVADEADVTISSAAVGLHTATNRLTGAHLRVLGQLDRRECYRDDGAVTAASWLRARTRMDHPDAATLLHAARRLDPLPALRAALESGEVSLKHVQAVTSACVPARAEAFADADEVLAALARDVEPRLVRVAVRRITDCTDPDGSDDPDELPTGPRDVRRELRLHTTIDGLWNLVGTLDAATGEKLAALLDALDRPDGADTPPEQRRSPAQRRHDALDDVLDRAMAADDLPEVHGRRPHVLAMIDLFALAKLVGLLPEGVIDDDRAAARMRYTGPISPAMALHLLATATTTLVLTEGPWRPVNVGRRMRTLPPALRDILQMLHLRCRGPDCDRLISWTEAHHLRPWAADHADTDLNDTIPVCKAHHKLCDQGWTVTLDTTTGIVTWTTPTGRTVTVHP